MLVHDYPKPEPAATHLLQNGEDRPGLGDVGRGSQHPGDVDRGGTGGEAQQILDCQDAEDFVTMGGVPSLWDGFLQNWVQRLVKRQPGLSLIAEVLGPEALVRRVVEETMDIAFVFEAPQMPELMVREIAVVKLLLVSSTAGQRAADAVGSGYVLVDWGTSFAVAHARAYRDAPAALIKMSLGRLAREFILACGGAAYLAEPLVADDLREGRLFLVADAPVIDRSAHAVYSPRSNRQDFLLESLDLLSTGREPAAD